MKPRGTVRGTDDPVPIPSASPNSIDWECELALVIGRGGKNIPTEEAPAYIGGLLVFNDFSDRHFRPLADRDDGPWDPFFDWLHGKWHDGFSAMGPVVVTPDEFPEGISDLPVRLRVNGVVRQDSSTQQMIFNPSELIGFLSRLVTLQPGDIIATGTPGGVAAGLKCPFLKPGDIVEAEIAGIGVLRNRIVAEASL
jgi:2-keto-4-pentenoate hydratase/2-oxohepta-3-ene-1,7-dioic acid hydratase in catechol pathway